MTVHFDFNAFVDDVVRLPSRIIRERTVSEIAALNAEKSREAKVEFARALYLRKLARLLSFLDQRKMPPDVTPKERAAYKKLAEWLALEDSAVRQPAPVLSN